MKEELIRVDNGHFLSEGSDYQFDIFIARGECIGIYVDEHLTSGTASKAIPAWQAAQPSVAAIASER